MSSVLTSHRRPTDLSASALLLRGLHLDGLLLAGIAAIMVVGLLALYSAVGQSGTLVVKQAIRLAAALAAMLLVAQIPPAWLRRTCITADSMTASEIPLRLA